MKLAFVISVIFVVVSTWITPQEWGALGYILLGGLAILIIGTLISRRRG